MAADLIFFYMHINWPLWKFKIIVTLKRGHKGQFICIQKNIKLLLLLLKIFTEECSIHIKVVFMEALEETTIHYY